MVHYIERDSAKHKRWEDVKKSIEGFRYSWTYLSHSTFIISLDEEQDNIVDYNPQDYRLQSSLSIMNRVGSSAILDLINEYISDNPKWSQSRKRGFESLVKNIDWEASDRGRGYWESVMRDWNRR